MEYLIRLGIPEIKEYWDKLNQSINTNTANKDETIRYNKLGKVFKLLSTDPFYPSLNSHEIDQLSKRYNRKVFESYIENRKPAAGRIFWVYGPNKNEITIIGIEPHPNDKSNSYKKITLSSTEE